MTNLTNWQDHDIEALGGDFDGSLSGLCIMSLSFDFTRSNLGGNSQQIASGDGPAAGLAHLHPNQRATSSPPTNLAITASSVNSSNPSASKTAVATTSQDASLNENNMSAFKKFKSSLMLQKSCFTSTASLSALGSTGSNQSQNSQLQTHYSSISLGGQSRPHQQQSSTSILNGQLQRDFHSSLKHEREESPLELGRNLRSTTPLSEQDDLNQDELDTQSRNSSDQEEEEEDEQEEEEEEDEDTNEGDLKSPDSPESVLSAASSSSASSRSRSTGGRCPSKRIRLNSSSSSNNNNQSNNNESQDLRINTHAARSSGMKPKPSGGGGVVVDQPQQHHTNQQHLADMTSYSFKDKLPHSHGLSQSGTQKEHLLNSSAHATGAMATAATSTGAPMHFKHHNHSSSSNTNNHHHYHPTAFSPYHQFSNSSFNHDFYDRYLSHDSHQPLQTPLIGIERTQDLLSLRLPPHGAHVEDTESHQRFPRDWLQQSHSGAEDNSKRGHSTNNRNSSNQHHHRSSAGAAAAHHDNDNDNDDDDDEADERRHRQKDFQFSSYKSNSNPATSSQSSAAAAASALASLRDTRDEPIDLNINYSNNNNKSMNMFDESMKHFAHANLTSTSCTHKSRIRINQNGVEHQSNGSSSGNEDQQHHHQYHGQESMFGPDQASRQKFQYVLAAPISVATKVTEDTMTYLNQGQAYEIKLENVTDVSEAKKGFMCSIINIGFHERHMQQAENELWQQWSQQHPSERIFSVDMKLSYNVFGVESDGLNKYEFLWDSSKAAGVFIRINSISTEFTPRKHGGEKGIPFKLSIETFSYNSKTHDSYFISAACCQFKVFKPKGAERKIRSDRDKISKRPASEQDKYHPPCDHTIFRECSLNSLHPLADGSLGYYRHSHGHFASKQIGSNTASVGRNTPASTNGGVPSAHRSSVNSQQNSTNNSDNFQPQEHLQDNNNSSGSGNNRPTGGGNDSDTNNSSSRSHNNQNQNQGNNNQPSQNNSNANNTSQQRTHTDYSTSRLLQPYQHSSYFDTATSVGSNNNNSNTNQSDDQQVNGYSGQDQNGDQLMAFGSGDGQVSSELSPVLYHHGSGVQNSQHHHHHHLRSVSSLTGSSHHNVNGHHPPSHHHHPSQTPHFGVTPYYGHATAAPPPPPPPPPPMHSLQSLPTGPMAFSQASLATTTTPFRVSNLAISSTNHHLHHSHLNHNTHSSQLDPSQQQLGKTGDHHHPHPSMAMSSYGHHNHHQNEHLANGSSSNNNSAHCSSYVDCYGAQSEAPHSQNHHQSWGLNNSTHSNNSSCASRSCAANNHSIHQHSHHMNGNQQHHQQHQMHHQSYASEQAQDSPHKSHHSNDSPQSCFSGSVRHFRDNNTMSSYSSQMAPMNGNGSNGNSHHDEHQHHLDQDHQEHEQQQDGHESHLFNNTLATQQQQQLESIAVEPSINITLKSNCAEVLAWLMSNRFVPFAKTFANFSGADLLRLSKSELTEICGLADGIRLFNSLHNPPLKPRRKQFKTIKFAQIKRELRLKRRLK